ncbi:MAG: molybdopterin converting factor subunit 1 [Planctomycetota bacterium]|nr:MAG: molybdopterin converting factor subunit 1 [Planctomycetota bacterium]REK19924.1 MAG: molybdopterin converting factor subunit 1 [Planctomycetota bacterium]REK27489.1 MAG: molybdopterin converting factor subunit 1 [Planctomycetota bacterium]
MTVTVQLFARARDLAGTSSLELDLSEAATVGELREVLISQEPRLTPIARTLLVAVDGEYAANDAPVREGAEVACFPPVSGG